MEALLALGALRGIDETLEKTRAFHRDCGEDLRPANSYTSVEEYQMKGKSDFGADYLYLFDEGRWLVYGLYNDPDWNELNIIIGEKEEK